MEAGGDVGLDGIIPAYAGSTLLICVRMRDIEGSSPHTRGARRAAAEDRHAGGIIPAYAGSTS